MLAITPKRPARQKDEVRDAGNWESLAETAYRLKFSLYQTPPVEELKVDEFEQFAYDRLRVLKEIDQARVRGLRLQELQMRVREATSRYLPLLGNKREDIRKDVISHFALRLAFCRSTEREWFVRQECELLRFRLGGAGGEKYPIKSFIEQNDMKYANIDEKEFSEMESQLEMVKTTPRGVHTRFEFFKVPWHHVTNLVGDRRVLVRGGFAIVYQDNLIELVISKFQQHLFNELVKTFNHLPEIQEDKRLDSMLSHIVSQYLTTDAFYMPKRAGGAVDISQIDLLAPRSFPLCMANLHGNLRLNHHLKHGGRMQYGLFLKGIGVTLDAAMEFWRSEFCKRPDIDVKKFNSAYAYNIRHNYGKEGKSVDYSPYSCFKIITKMSPGPDENHGCPFRHFDEANLRRSLSQYGIKGGTINEIIDLVRGEHYQIACRKYYEAKHLNAPPKELTITHPNSYFDESMKYYSADGKGKGNKTANANPTEKAKGGGDMMDTLDEYEAAALDAIEADDGAGDA